MEFAISGYDSVSNVYVYVFDDIRQDFELIQNEMIGFEMGTLRFGDMDVDGIPDLVLSGGPMKYDTEIFSFSPEGNFINQLEIGNFGGSLDLFDFDNDLDLDIYAAGYNQYVINGWITYQLRCIVRPKHQEGKPSRYRYVSCSFRPIDQKGSIMDQFHITI